MNTLRTHRHHASLAACCLPALILALSLAAPATAAPYAFTYWQGPDEMVLPTWWFYQFNSTLTNTGDQPDSYTMTVTRQQPGNWYFFVTYDGVVEDTETVFQIPAFGTLAAGQAVDLEFEVMSDDDGTALYTVHVVSNSDSSQQRLVTYLARTPTESYDLLFSTGETLIVAEVDQFVQFHPVFYNAGTEEDTYHLTMVRNLPPNWDAAFCMFGVCFGEAETSLIPPFGGTVFGGDPVPMDIDFLTNNDSGTGSVTITIVSNTNSTLVAEATFTVTTGPTSAQDTPSILLSGVRAAPNPFNPRTDICFEIGGERARDVAIDLFDTTGRLVQRLHGGLLQPGSHTVAWDGNTRGGQPAAAGVYLARVRAGQETETIKLSLVK